MAEEGATQARVGVGYDLPLMSLNHPIDNVDVNR
jgi:hypothetical protein